MHSACHGGSRATTPASRAATPASRAPTPAAETLRALACTPPPSTETAGSWCSTIQSYRERAERVLTPDVGELAQADDRMTQWRQDWKEEALRRQVYKKDARVATRRAESRLHEAMTWSRQLEDRRAEGRLEERLERPRTAPAESVASSILRRSVVSIPEPTRWPLTIDKEEVARKRALGMLSPPPAYPPPLCPPPQSGKEARIRGMHKSCMEPPPKADGSVPVIDLKYYNSDALDRRLPHPETSDSVLAAAPPEPPSGEGWRDGADRVRYVQERNKGPLWLLEEDRAREAGVPVPMAGHGCFPDPYLDSDFPAASGTAATLIDMAKRGRLFRGMGPVTTTPF